MNYKTVETVEVQYNVLDAQDAALAAEMNKFLTSLGLELNIERPLGTSLSVEFSAYDVSTPFEELASKVESKFPGFESDITNEFNDGSLSGGVPHYMNTLSIFPSVYA